MKKSTKILIPAVAVLALGMAASVSGTVAWYTASTTQAVVDADTGAITAVASSISQDTLYLKPSFTVSAGTNDLVALTDCNGDTFVGSNGKLQAANVPTGAAKYAEVTIIYHWYTNEACTQEASAAQISGLGASSHAFTLTATGRGRVAVSAATVYGTANAALPINVTSGLTAVVAAGGGVTTTGLTAEKFYVSISGDAITNQDRAAGEAIGTDDGASGNVSTTVSFNFTENA